MCLFHQKVVVCTALPMKWLATIMSGRWLGFSEESVHSNSVLFRHKIVGLLCHVILRAYFSIVCLALRKRGHTWLYFCGFCDLCLSTQYFIIGACYIFGLWALSAINQEPVSPLRISPPHLLCCRFWSGVSSHCSRKGFCIWGPCTKSGFLNRLHLDLYFL